MPRAFWRGAISFGMVVIPIRMYVATQSTTPSFHLLHNKCLTRPKQVLYCELDNEYFTRTDTLRGYEYSRGHYVVLEEDDFEKVPVKTSHTIDIFGFVDPDEIDPIYIYDTHYLEPEELGMKPFSLFRQALDETHRVGMAKVAFQKREHLCFLRPTDSTIFLHTLHFQNEIRSADELLRPEIASTAEEVNMAKSLVEVMATRFEPERYRDDYQEALKNVIEAKLKGEEIKAPTVVRPEFPDLMTALRQSVEEARKKVPAETGQRG